ncbi:MAG: NAD-binding protein [Bacteroidetes bacterium]|jgi:trk system potassium uptake protein TrkA|nr:NAD-binding protein [Bacteroidota bacterium]
MPSRPDLHVIIAGGGEVGLRTAHLLNDRGHDLTIIERDADRCSRLGDEYVATIIQGNATLPEIFEQAAPQSADVVAALTNDIPANLAICMMAKHLHDNLHTVMRTDTEIGDAHADLVDAVVYPERASALLAVNAIIGGDVRAIEDVMGEIEIMEVRVSEAAPARGKTLEDVSFPSGSLVISDHEGSRIARPDTVLEAGRRYIVAADPEVVDEIMRLLRG